MKKCQDISLLNAIVPLLQDQKGEQLHVKLKVFITQELQSGATVRELITEFSQLQTVNFDTKGLSSAICGPEHLLWMATITGISSIAFLFSLGFFNHFFLQPARKSSKQKGPTSVTDLLLMCSFIISLICCTLLAVILRWRKLRKELSPISRNQDKGMRRSSTEANRALEEHDIHFGRRPDFQGTISTLYLSFLIFRSLYSHLALKKIKGLTCDELNRYIFKVSRWNEWILYRGVCVWTWNNERICGFLMQAEFSGFQERWSEKEAMLQFPLLKFHTLGFINLSIQRCRERFSINVSIFSLTYIITVELSNTCIWIYIYICHVALYLKIWGLIQQIMSLVPYYLWLTTWMMVSI